MKKMFRKKALILLWIVAYPMYQVIGTIRHEGSHALVAWVEGAHIQQFVFWPSMRNGHFFWGYVYWTGTVNWYATAAPYVVDLLTATFTFVLLFFWKPRRQWVALNIWIIGILSPLGNSLYNYIHGLEGSKTSDVGKLFLWLPHVWIHSYFISTAVVYIAMTIILYYKNAKVQK